jgi:TonB-linked SusC/RagA family outer membrane protein
MRNPFRLAACAAYAATLAVVSGRPLAAQDRVITGTVTDTASAAPLPSVTVRVKTAAAGALTDASGRYRISAPPGATLVFTRIGYTPREVPVGDRATVDVALAARATVLNEVVAIGYGEQSRARLTTAVSTVDTAALKNIPYANVASALQGTVPGLRVQTTSGQPGASPRIVLRGGTSINNPNGAAPLFIVDGVIRPGLDDINPMDIERVDVLKDAGATAIYGARASNGVVVVTTRGARPGPPQFTYSGSLQSSRLGRRMPLLSARDYIHFARLGVAATAELTPSRLAQLAQSNGYGTGNDLTNRTAFTPQYLSPANEHKLREGWQQMPDPLDPTKTIIYQETDWQDVLFRTGATQNHHLSVSGGGDVGSYNLAVGYLDNQGIAITTGYRRLTLDMGGRVRARERLTLSGDVQLSNAQDDQVFSDNQIFQRALGLPPTAKLHFEDGTLAPGQSRSIGNPLYHLSRSKANNRADRLSVGVRALWEITPQLTFEPSASLLNNRGWGDAFQLSYFNTATQFVDARDASAAYNERWQRQADAVLTFEDDFARHNVQLTAGASYFDRRLSALSAAGRGASTDLIPTLNAAATPVAVSSTRTDQVIDGFFGRLTYDYDGRYLLMSTLRYDGASNLGADHRWGVFPSVSAGWNLHREGFWRALPDAISSLKLRTSYGTSGNISGLSDFHAQGEYSVGIRYNGVAAIQNNRLANQDLRWERSTTLDGGFDLGLFDDRVSVLFDAYRRRTDDLLTDLALSQSTGFQSLLTNLGSLENRGIEVGATALLLRDARVEWSVSANAATNRNRILRLPDNGVPRNRVGGLLVYDPRARDTVWVGGLQEGGRLGDLYAYEQLGVYATAEEAAAGPRDNLVPGTDKRKRAGDAKFADLDENGVIDSRDQVYVGNIYPTWTGGVTNTVRVGRVSLAARVDFATGHTIFNQSLLAYNGQTQGDIGASREVLRSWQKPGDVTDVPRYYWADQLAQNNIFRNNLGTSYYYEKGDYLALREVTLSVDVPPPLLRRARVRSARVYATGSNLHYFTGYKGLSPEDGGTDTGRYPNPRNLTLGLNLGF